LRHWPAFAVAVVCLALALAAPVRPASADPTLSYGCDPPLPRAPENCAIWHTSAVTIVWSWDINSDPVQGCGKQVIDHDTDGLRITCEVMDNVGTSLSKTATIRLDMTPPVIASAVPARPPDYADWWNHPVAFAFQATDATSGTAGCDTFTYSGPGSEAASVSGGCRDVAGNSATRSFPLKYDSDPPTLSGVAPVVRNGKVTVRWQASPDTALVEVTRSPGTGGAASSKVYSGLAAEFTDTAVKSGVTYRYWVSARDPAGNVTSQTVSATPSRLVPVNGARLRGPPLLQWPKVKRAGYYNVQLYRGSRKVLSAWPARARLQLPRSWNFRGQRYRLAPGHYRWYIWPGFGSRTAHRYGKLIGSARFTIVR